ncbi:glycoside hydrolase family 3 protein [Luedemannella flava]|uniref:Glycoside hydrolase family 3 protein n=1 Tax=Luedemannella flava TaxID=349316 RepID=A0ABN2LIV4_9ACTN
MTGSPLRRLALGTLLPAFHGHRPPDWAVRLVEEGLGGYTLFGYNIRDAAQVSSLTAQLRAARPDVVIATDEEGGDVTRLHYAEGSPYPGNAALGVVDDVTLTESVYRAIGARLASVGITLDMAPAVDVNSADDNPAIGTRSFGDRPARVAAPAAAAVAGLQAAGVAACAKHFPGHGATVTDSHLDLPLVEAPLSVLRQRELPPFAAAIAAGARSVMTAHIRVPELTGSSPATFSRRTLRDLLRDELGFTGAIVSDALEMRGASAAIGIPEAAVRALAAGNDLLCFGGELAKSPDAEAVVEKTVAAIIAAVEEGRLSEADLAASVARNALLGTLPAVTDAVAADSLGLAAARRAVRVSGDLPAGLADAVVVQLMPPATAAVGEVPWGLAPVLPGVRPVVDTASAADLIALAGTRPLVVASRDTHRHPWARTLVEALAAGHPGVILVEMGWPAAWRPANATYVATYGAAPVNARAAAESLGLPPSQ